MISRLFLFQFCHKNIVDVTLLTDTLGCVHTNRVESSPIQFSPVRLYIQGVFTPTESSPVKFP